MNLDSVIITPVVTEKGTLASETANQVVFRVRPQASKDLIRAAVEQMFKVTVLKVRTSNFMGKERRRGKFTGFRPDWKKAYVRLKAGEKIPEYAQNL